MRNIALKLMYNGTAYHGWQMQRTEASVQETLQRGLSMICGEKVKLTGVGRTDAGVHAERYVANFRTSSRIPAAVFCNMANRPFTVGISLIFSAMSVVLVVRLVLDGVKPFPRSGEEFPC